jgi:hypothetical protein
MKISKSTELPIKVCLTSPPSPSKKEATAQAMHRGDGLTLQVWKKRVCYKRATILTKQSNNRKTVAHIIYPRESHTIRPCHWISMTKERVQQPQVLARWCAWTQKKTAIETHTMWNEALSKWWALPALPTQLIAPNQLLIEQLSNVSF